MSFIPIPFLKSAIPVLIDLTTIPVRGILRLLSNSATISMGVPGLRAFLVLMKRPVAEKSEDVPLYSVLLSEKVIDRRLILR